MKDCIFCKIASGEIKAQVVHEDTDCVAFRDQEPQAPKHILIIPKVHVESLDTTHQDQEKMLGHLLLVASQVAKKEGLSDNGYRCVINTNRDGGQMVFHLHLHLIGGRKMGWPPG